MTCSVDWIIQRLHACVNERLGLVWHSRHDLNLFTVSHSDELFSHGKMSTSHEIHCG